MSTSQEKGNDQTTLNDQIKDSISSLQKMLNDNAGNDAAALSYQVMAQATGLAMLNVVNQQQQMFILQNAITAATAKAVLEAKPEEAVRIINDVIKNSNMLETFNGLKNFMDELTKTYHDLREKATAKKEEPATETKKKSDSGSKTK